jgi:hypothetical protein
MGTLFAIHVRARESAGLAARLARHGKLLTDDSSQFATVELNRFDGPTEDDLAELASLSSDLETDVLWVGYSSVSDAFRYHHWQLGQSVRSLAYGWFDTIGIWDFAEGTPEPWEQPTFFHPSALDYWIIPEEEDERAVLRHILITGEIRAGLKLPSVDVRVAARMIGEEFGLLGWT